MLNEDYFNGLHTSPIRVGGVFQYASNTANNATVIIYTVGAGYELLLTQVYMASYTMVLGDAYVSVWNAAPVEVYKLNIINLTRLTGVASGGNIIPPIVIAAGFTIRLTSANINTFSECSLIGYRYTV